MNDISSNWFLVTRGTEEADMKVCEFPERGVGSLVEQENMSLGLLIAFPST